MENGKCGIVGAHLKKEGKRSSSNTLMGFFSRVQNLQLKIEGPSLQNFFFKPLFLFPRFISMGAATKSGKTWRFEFWNNCGKGRKYQLFHNSMFIITDKPIGQQNVQKLEWNDQLLLLITTTAFLKNWNWRDETRKMPTKKCLWTRITDEN